MHKDRTIEDLKNTILDMKLSKQNELCSDSIEELMSISSSLFENKNKEIKLLKNIIYNPNKKDLIEVSKISKKKLSEINEFYKKSQKIIEEELLQYIDYN
jgi:hypothetical protein